jgi:hypothetical protein
MNNSGTAVLIDLPVKRPIAITLISIFMGIGFAVAIFFLISGKLHDFGTAYKILFVSSTLVGFICMIGLWNMRRWAVILYAAFFIINLVVLFYLEKWSAQSALIPLCIIGITFSYYPRMR